ncbi:DinB family protein [Flavobacterium sp.]|uniref:DinB family protein n=1 Tax=Flavobacterium sp. TaxID=239 RepID=UPI0025BEA109|nr:DinB family protein [Flavobacterium sp.]
MKEKDRIIKLFKELYNGDPWLDSSISGNLSNIDAEWAAQKPRHVTNSIWEIVNHLSIWREVVLDRINGAEADTPDHNYFLPIADKSEKAWSISLRKLEKSQEDWLGFLDKLTDEKLSQRYLETHYTVYDLIFGIMQHDAYHLGQLALLKNYEL